MKPDLRLKEIGALNISTGHDIHATEAASAVAIKNAFKIVIKIKIAFSNMIWYDSITHTANNHELTLHWFSAASFDLCQEGVIILYWYDIAFCRNVMQ